MGVNLFVSLILQHSGETKILMIRPLKITNKITARQTIDLITSG